MSTKASTDHAPCTFTVKEYGDGTPWIMFEMDSPGLPALGDGFIGLRFRPDVTFEQAAEIARTLRDHFEGISHTRFGK